MYFIFTIKDNTITEKLHVSTLWQHV